MLQRSFSTSTARACWLGDQRVASRVPRLASKLQPTASGSHLTTPSSHLVQPVSSSSTDAYPSRRSISEAFGLLAGSTASARTGLRNSRHASTWSGATRGFASTSSARDLKQDAKDKVVEEGKKFVQQTVNEKFNPQSTDKLAEEGKKIAQQKVDETLGSGASSNRLVEEGKKFARDQLNSQLGAQGQKQQAKNLSSSTSKILFAALAVAVAAYQFLGGETHAEEASSSPKYTKEQVSLLCLVGPSLSGKTTQAKRLHKRFPSEIDDIVSPKTFDELSSIIASRSDKKRISLLLDNFPTTLEDAERIEKELVQIFCFSFYDLPLKDFEKRLPGKDEKERKKEVDEFNKYSEKLEPLVKKYRDQGNIYEISADWESADEVWEQVEAKTESIFELRERGDL